MKVFYTKANIILRLFHCYLTDVKLALLCSYCVCFYCLFLWTHYNCIVLSQLIASLELLLTMYIVAY